MGVDCLMVAAGGALGSVARYLLSLIPFAGAFPPLTWITNMVGSLLIGILMGALGGGGHDRALLLWKVGFCGGFTTFSTFALESYGLLDKNQGVMAVAYLAVSCVVGIVCVAVGYGLGRRFAL